MSDLLQGVNNQATESQQQAQPAEQAEQSSTLFEYNGRKFDAQEAIKKMEHADKYIDEQKQKERELTERLERLEQELAKSKKLDDALNELKATRQEQPQGANTTQPQGVDAEKLKQEVLRAIQAEQQQATVKAKRDANLAQSHELASTKYGQAYMDKLVLEAKQRNLDLTAEDIIDLAASKPATFSELFGLKSQSKPQAAPIGGQRPPIEQRASGNKDWKAIAAEVAQGLGVQYDSAMHSIPKAGGIRR
jgi:hypothetical protein